MKRLLLLATLLISGLNAAAPTHWLLTFQLASGLEIGKFTAQQMATFAEHGKYLASLQSKGLVAGGRTEETTGTLAILILACDEATARQAAAGDPATRAGYLKSAVHPFSLLMPPLPAAPLVNDGRTLYDQASKYLVAAARLMPEESYGFRPAPEVRTFGQVVGHIAEAQYIACSLTRGEEYRPRGIEEKFTSKADLVAALEAGIGFCRESWSRLTPADASSEISLFGQKRTRLGAMETATAHAFEHYGNMVTYLRMRGIVPPSSTK